MINHWINVLSMGFLPKPQADDLLFISAIMMQP
jgi:hypothetical protein